MNDNGGCIFLIDDDEAIRSGISMLLSSAGYEVMCFGNAEDFMKMENSDLPGCILLDIFLEGKSGLELQEEIRGKFDHFPIIYITGHGDVPMSVRALKNGAINFLQKPVDEADLFNSITEAMAESSRVLLENAELTMIRSLMGKLASRETDIFRHLIKGMPNKQIASELHIIEQTVKVHRGRITAKLGVKSVAEMVHLAERIKFS